MHYYYTLLLMLARWVKATGYMLLDSIVNSAFQSRSEWTFNAERNVAFQKEGILEKKSITLRRQQTVWAISSYINI